MFATIAFYVFVYTIWLKRKTPQNIVIGGASGALPPVIGWTIATNSLTFEPITFFLIIFFWTPSHFWALSLYKANDYEKAKIPMLPITNGIEETKTDSSESRNTAAAQRATKFAFLRYFQKKK